MNLTIGPLPPAVYWRRRAIVVGAVLFVVLFLVYSCGGSGGSAAGDRAAAQSSHFATATGFTSPTASPASDFSTAPVIGAAPVGGGPSDESAQPAPAPTGPPPACSDADISLTVAIEPLSVGFYVTLKVKNISKKTCTRDVGADPQEMHVVNSKNQTVWSSDYCQTVHGKPDVRTFAPNIEDDFRIYWNGHAYAPGCVKQGALPAGGYSVVSKLGTKVSAAVRFTVSG